MPALDYRSPSDFNPRVRSRSGPFGSALVWVSIASHNGEFLVWNRDPAAQSRLSGAIPDVWPVTCLIERHDPRPDVLPAVRSEPRSGMGQGHRHLARLIPSAGGSPSCWVGAGTTKRVGAPEPARDAVRRRLNQLRDLQSFQQDLDWRQP
jgi:hypothetical protein